MSESKVVVYNTNVASITKTSETEDVTVYVVRCDNKVFLVRRHMGSTVVMSMKVTPTEGEACAEWEYLIGKMSTKDMSSAYFSENAIGLRRFHGNRIQKNAHNLLSRIENILREVS